MKDKTVIVFGAGRFGSALATELFENNVEVMIVDIDGEKIQNIAPKVTTAVEADIMDEAALDELGVSNFDIAVIAIGSNLEASIVATVYCKEKNVPKIIAKATTDLQSKILKKVGADLLIYPEIEMGSRLAKSISGKNILEYIHFNDEYSISEIAIMRNWENRSLEELDMRNKFNINVIAILRDDRTVVSPKAGEILEHGDYLVVIGRDEDLEKLERNV